MSRIVTFLQLFGGLTRFRIQDHFLDRQLRFAPDHLHRFRQSLPGDGSAQDIVTRYRRPKGSQEPIKPFARVKVLTTVCDALREALKGDQPPISEYVPCGDRPIPTTADDDPERQKADKVKVNPEKPDKAKEDKEDKGDKEKT